LAQGDRGWPVADHLKTEAINNVLEKHGKPPVV
jgi:hypothetical protein